MEHNGFLLINKPASWTSHDVVGYMRRVTHIKRIGHAGTLDPFATGLLIVALGRENTKRLDEFKDLKKIYRATVHLGATSTTYDKTGIITEKSAQKISIETIRATLKKFIGEQEQMPPMYSAKKVDGKKLYKLARKGIEVERKPHRITIFSIKLIEYSYPLLTLEVTCSSGTYIRTLTHDIGEILKVGAYCEALERTHIGKYSIKNATPIKSFSRDTWKNQSFPIKKSFFLRIISSIVSFVFGR